ncbi:MAG: sigma-70 family RNA polymerase sigma factor [Acidobacteria bacterium]|nr:MAG: sigma-70 family RNA polymerase sigma factor [Acidobacteriota bacterium]
MMAKPENSWSDWLKSILEQHETALVRYACRLTGDVEVARDVVQDTFVTLCRQGPGAVEDHVVPWLFRVCRNRALDIIKGRHPDCPITEMENRMPDGHESPGDLLERKEKLALILELLETLPANQREVVALKFQHDLSYKEISSVTGLSVTNVGFLIHTGLKNIKERLSVEAPPRERVLRRVK